MISGISCFFSVGTLTAIGADQAAKPRLQYDHAGIEVPAARGDEPVRSEFSLSHAVRYLEQGANAWVGNRGCVSCHTPGTYMTTFPALTPFLGKPSSELRKFFISELIDFKAYSKEKFQKGTSIAQVVYIAAGLAEWDRHVAKELSPETADALTLMFSQQQENGAWQSLDCWPPFESSAFQEATVAAMAAVTAPGWLDENEAGRARFQRTLNYLRTTRPRHDYERVLLLRASTSIDRLISTDERRKIIGMVLKHQRPNGGWSIRSFAQPDEWGKGNRAKKLRAESEFENPPSDGHMTGLCVMALRGAGVPAADEHLAKAVSWLLKNQRESGRWWTRSLNTDKYHFITYSGTAYPLLALAKCGKLPAFTAEQK